MRLVRAQPGNKPARPLLKSLRFPGRARGWLRLGVAASTRLNLSPGSRQRQRRRAPGPRPPRSPQVPSSFSDNSFVRGSLRPPPPGCGRAAAGSTAAGLAGAVTLRVRGGILSWAGEAGRVAAAGACGVGGCRRRRGFCTWREGPSGTGALVESHFYQPLICKPVRVLFPSRGFTWRGRDRGCNDTQSLGRALVLHYPKWLLGHPPAPDLRPQTLGTMLVARDRAVGAPVSCASCFAKVSRPRTPPEAGLPPSDCPGSLSRTVCTSNDGEQRTALCNV